MIVQSPTKAVYKFALVTGVILKIWCPRAHDLLILYSWLITWTIDFDLRLQLYLYLSVVFCAVKYYIVLQNTQ